MNIGMIGAGAVSLVVARYALAVGQHVVSSSRSGGHKLAASVAKLGPEDRGVLVPRGERGAAGRRRGRPGSRPVPLKGFPKRSLTRDGGSGVVARVASAEATVET